MVLSIYQLREYGSSSSCPEPTLYTSLPEKTSGQDGTASIMYYDLIIIVYKEYNLTWVSNCVVSTRTIEHNSLSSPCLLTCTLF